MTETMELPPIQARESWPPGSAAPPEPLDRTKQFAMAVRLAAMVTMPVDYIDDEHCQAGPLGPGQMRTIASHPAFRKPLNRLVADMTGFSAAKFQPEMLSRLAVSPQARLAVLLVTAPMPEVRNAALALAAAALSERVRGLILKADRDKIRDVLGPAGFHIAVHEVPLLHPSLCELDALPADGLRLAGGRKPMATPEEVVMLGFHAVGRFLDATDPVLAEFFSRRLPEQVNYSERHRSIKPFGQAHCEHAVKLIRRRQPQWSAIIG